MSKITYKALFDNTSTAVYLDGKRVGRIHYNGKGGWRYHPLGVLLRDVVNAGELFSTLAACKRSLEAE
jgi:hypothetical protein